MGFEPTTPTLARLCSTPELHPLIIFQHIIVAGYAHNGLVRRLYGAWGLRMQQEFLTIAIQIKCNVKQITNSQFRLRSYKRLTTLITMTHTIDAGLARAH